MNHGRKKINETESLSPAAMLEKSILVVAHPDDEVLWFSSVIEEVDEILICFQGSRTHPQWKVARARSLAEHPVRNIDSLGLEQAGIFNGADWQNPEASNYGMKIVKEGPAKEWYLNNHRQLEKILIKRLAKYCNVITHNPWGEYGHEEHVQIYQVIKGLQSRLSFNLWFGNYCSNRSYPFMLQHLRGFDSDYFSLPTKSALGEKVKSIYQANDCWTWYDDYVWFHEESFMRDRKREGLDVYAYGHRFPLNFVKIDVGESKSEEKGKRSFWRRMLRVWS